MPIVIRVSSCTFRVRWFSIGLLVNDLEAGLFGKVVDTFLVSTVYKTSIVVLVLLMIAYPTIFMFDSFLPSQEVVGHHVSLQCFTYHLG